MKYFNKILVVILITFNNWKALNAKDLKVHGRTKMLTKHIFLSLRCREVSLDKYTSMPFMSRRKFQYNIDVRIARGETEDELSNSIRRDFARSLAISHLSFTLLEILVNPLKQDVYVYYRGRGRFGGECSKRRA